MNSKSKITIIVLCQIALIVGSFLSVAVWESQFSLFGNSVNIAGKNRFLTSQFLHESYAHVDLFNSHSDDQLTELEQNILFLKNGGIQENIKLNPLDSQFNSDWELVYEQLNQVKTEYQNLKLRQLESNLSSDDLKTLEVSSLILIDYSDQLVHKMGLAIDNSTAMLINFQIFLLGTNVTVHIGMIVLISRIFRNEFELILQKEKLATVGELSSRLAHDMRNPLSVIQMSTQLLKSKSTEKETSEKLDVIEKGITRMSHQINDVMDFVRTKEPELKLWDVNSILDDCFGRFKLSDSVRLTLPQKSTLVKCDRSQIEILFINLISNSLDSIKNKGSIRVRTQSDEHETKIEFIDSGDGVPEEKLDEIFEPLVTYKESGTGLGLASCKNIVKNHKGTISAKNNPTTFTITLPN